VTRLRVELSGVRISGDPHLHLVPRMKIGWSYLLRSSIESACSAFKSILDDLCLREPVVVRRLAR